MHMVRAALEEWPPVVAVEQAWLPLVQALKVSKVRRQACSSTECVAKRREQVSQAQRSYLVSKAIVHQACLTSAHCCVPLCFDAGSAAPGSDSQADEVMACSSCPPVCIAVLVACACCYYQEPW